MLYFIRNGKDDPESIPANKPYGEKPDSNADVIAKYFNKKAYTDPAMRLKFTKGGYWVNIRLIRYADVVLMASEAACELGDLSSARNYLEMVRARARGNNIGILPEVTTNNQNELREAIRHERRVELGMELTVSTTWFVGGLLKRYFMRQARPVIKTDMLCCPFRKTKLTSRMVYWFKIPIINL